MSNEIKITVLKRGKDPKPLTAKAPVRTLEEHRLAFLAANNKNGFLLEESDNNGGVDSIFQLFYTIRTTESFTTSVLGEWVAKLTLFTKNSGLPLSKPDALVVIYKTLGFQCKKDFEVAGRKTDYGLRQTWVNPKYMAPMSEFVFETEVVESDDRTIAFYNKIDAGFRKPSSRVFYPTLPWNTLNNLFRVLEKNGNVTQEKLRNVSMELARTTKRVIINTVGLEILSRLLGYEAWTEAKAKTAGGFIKCRRDRQFYTQLLEEFGNTCLDIDKEKHDQETSHCFD